MLVEQIPKWIDPTKFARHQRTIQGDIPLKQFSHLHGLPIVPEGNLSVDAFFGIDDQGLNYIEGYIQAELVLQCQRCLENMNYSLRSEFSLSPVDNDEQAQKIPSHYEPVIKEAEGISFEKIMEEELILSLPIVPMHTVEQECLIPTSGTNTKQMNPFEVLKNLKLNSKED